MTAAGAARGDEKEKNGKAGIAVSGKVTIDEGVKTASENSKKLVSRFEFHVFSRCFLTT
ncbi:MAG: hypothetical protein OEY21_08890 [Nitrospira sp.]|nr:hypothetical protein [Nitrospira sp.]